MCSASVAGLLVVWPVLAHATIYSWKGDGGVLMVSNNPEDVPEDKRASVQTFTSKPAPKRVRKEEATPDTSKGEAEAFEAYQRGFERGLQAAERQIAFAQRFAASVPQAPPISIVIEQPAPPAPGYDYPAPSYAPYAPYPLGYYTYGFAGRFGPHRHFFPDIRARGRSFSRAAFGRMR